MRLTLVSDLHLDARTGGMARHDDIERSLFDAVEFANANADLFLCLGDVMDPDSGSCVFRCVRTLVEVTQRLKIPSVWLTGNHDVMEDGSGESTLEPLKRISKAAQVIDDPGVCIAAGPLGEQIPILAFPFTPYVKKYSPKAALKDVVHGEHVRLVIGHLNVRGAVPGDETEMVRGREVWLPVKEIRETLGDVPVANGHIHRHQVTDDNILIVGSLERLRFDEERHRVGWVEMIL